MQLRNALFVSVSLFVLAGCGSNASSNVEQASLLPSNECLDPGDCSNGFAWSPTQCACISTCVDLGQCAYGTSWSQNDCKCMPTCHERVVCGPKTVWSEQACRCMPMCEYGGECQVGTVWSPSRCACVPDQSGDPDGQTPAGW